MKSNFFLDYKKEVAQGIVAPQDSVNKKAAAKLKNLSIGEGVFILSKKEKRNLKLTKEELKLIKPLYTSSELKRFHGNKKTSIGLYILIVASKKLVLLSLIQI